MSTGNFEYYGVPPVQRGIEYRYERVATAGQVLFDSLIYTVGMVDVYVQGLILPLTSYTAINGTSVTLNRASLVGEVVKIISRSTYLVSSQTNAYTTSQSDSLYATIGSVSLKADSSSVSTRGRLYFYEM